MYRNIQTAPCNLQTFREPNIYKRREIFFSLQDQQDLQYIRSQFIFVKEDIRFHSKY